MSVVIPTRDRWTFLTRAISAALEQEAVRVEAIVVDDGSRDGTAEGLSALRDSRLKTIRNEAPRGVARSRNLGIEAARGSWIAFLDDDDLWSPAKLRTQMAAAHGAGAVWSYGAALVVDERRRPIRMSKRPPEPGAVLRELLSRNPLPAGSSNVIVRTDVARSLGGFDERLAQLADWDFWLRLAAKGPPEVVQQVLVAYTEHSSNMLLQDPRAVMAELEYIARKHESASRAAQVEFDRVELSRWVAWGHRRAGHRSRAAATYLHGAIAYRSPGNVVRAIAVLFGERPMSEPGSPAGVPLQTPTWLSQYD